MPANLTPQYRKAEEAFRSAATLEEKIERLEEMIALLPKHKGTDHLYGDLKRRLAKLRSDEDRTRKSRRGPTLDFSREGAAQIILIGPPNAGKSSVLAALTNASPHVADYPFTTHAPQPGMVHWEDIQLQLIDTPPVTADFMPTHLPGLLRGADLALLVADLSSDSVLDDLDVVRSAFARRSAVLVGSLDQRLEPPLAPVCAIILANKLDASDTSERLSLLREALEPPFTVYPLSCATREGVAGLPSFLVTSLGLVRVYTKAPGRKPDFSHPFTVFRGGTVEDVCVLVHKDFVANLKFARLWRGSADPVVVSRDHPLEDRDVLELHV
ncbi:MAG: GTPase [Planctomycetota bacterium]